MFTVMCQHHSEGAEDPPSSSFCLRLALVSSPHNPVQDQQSEDGFSLCREFNDGKMIVLRVILKAIIWSFSNYEFVLLHSSEGVLCVQINFCNVRPVFGAS